MIKLIKPYINFDEVQTEFREIFDTGWFTKGKYVEAFRQELKNYTKAKHTFLTTSATTALSTCLKILEIKTGDEVIVSDFSFPATANVVEDIGATTVFADVQIDTFNMSTRELENKITKKTKAIIFVDALGNPSGLHAIHSICKDRKIPLIEDAACSIGSSENKKRCGNIADLTCFSFHPRKLLTTGEGGAITLNSDFYAQKLDIKLNHGAIQKNNLMDFVDYGYNYRLPELQAVMGIKQLQKLEKIVNLRNEVRTQYVAQLASLRYKPQVIAADVEHNIQSMVFIVPKNVSRNKLIAHLKNYGIESTLGTYCLSGCSYFKKKYDDVQKNANFLFEHTITLPCYDGLDVEYVCDSIRKYK